MVGRIPQAGKLPLEIVFRGEDTQVILPSHPPSQLPPRKPSTCWCPLSWSTSRDGPSPSTPPRGWWAGRGTAQPSTRMSPSYSGRTQGRSRCQVEQLPHQPISTHRFTCDADGWVFRANSESPYPHFFHVLSPSDIQAVTITGDVEISFVGFGDSECRTVCSEYSDIRIYSNIY